DVGAGAAEADAVGKTAAVEPLRPPPRRGGPLGGWLATIVQRVAARQRRGERRRAQRERQVARHEAMAPDTAGEQRELFCRLHDAGLALAEPYQQTILLRYPRRLPPRARAP